jgi:hypothetical protein
MWKRIRILSLVHAHKPYIQQHSYLDSHWSRSSRIPYCPRVKKCVISPSPPTLSHRSMWASRACLFPTISIRCASHAVCMHTSATFVFGLILAVLIPHSLLPTCEKVCSLSSPTHALVSVNVGPTCLLVSVSKKGRLLETVKYKMVFLV